MSSDTAALHPPVKTPLHWPSLIQLILSLLAALILFGACVVIAISAAIPLMTGSTSAADPTGSFMSAASLAFAGILMHFNNWKPLRPKPQNQLAVITFPQCHCHWVARLVGDLHWVAWSHPRSA
jgi:hypothetical protein